MSAQEKNNIKIPEQQDEKLPVEQSSSDDKNKSIIDLLLEKNVLTKDQLNIAVAELYRRKDNSRLLDVIIQMGFVPELSISEIISGQKKSKSVVNLSEVYIDPNLLKKIPEDFAKKNHVIAISEDERIVKVVVADLFDIFILDQVASFFPTKKVKPFKASRNEIIDVIDRSYKHSINVIDIIDELDAMSFAGQDISDAKISPIPRLVEAIMAQSIRLDASDIHFEPDEYFVRVRIRIDGVLMNKISFHVKYWNPVCVRLKIMSSMNIAESRKPQDGGISMTFFGRKIDFRVSSIPTVHGENFVLRILDNTKSITTLHDLGYSKRNQELIDLILKKPEGILIVTGPTGSGKTTTLYSILAKINNVQDNIMTLEEPVEYQIPMIRQSEINPRAGFDFNSGLRALLRQDPDIIFLGEIRDEETARTALRASSTGHQVFSTLHTNNALAAITRLLDIGVEGYLLADSLIGVVAQRLTRTLCVKCKEKTLMSDLDKEMFGLKKDKDYTIYKSVGCEHCLFTGYKGRVVISEVLYIDDELKFAIAEGKSMKDMIMAANRDGFMPMQKDGIIKILQGLTTFEELSSVVDMTLYIKRRKKLEERGSTAEKQQ